MVFLDEDVESLELDKKLIKKLKQNDLNNVRDVWILKRKELKTRGFTDQEIKSIIIALQLQGLDLNKKIYD